MPKDRVGFNNVVLDFDGTVRRTLIYFHKEGEPYHSFALRLAFLYLQAEGITPEASKNKSLKLGKTVFSRFHSYDAPYIRADDGGYQILPSRWFPPGSIERVSISETIEGRIPPEKFQDRIVLIGSTASSQKDFWKTPHSDRFGQTPEFVYGVELHAFFASQILDAALEGKSLMRSLPESLEIAWIFLWSLAGAGICWRLRSPGWSALTILGSGCALALLSYGAFAGSLWIPLIPSLLALTGSAVLITGYIAHLEEELQKSKSFLQSVIDTIPDPVFVEDERDRWIVLNETYCRFIGHARETLVERPPQEFFSPEEAAVFRQHSRLVRESGDSNECEEQFTDARGLTHIIATKRSLHRDAAGNLFLVGVIRDITARKRLEEELKKTAEDLAHSNARLNYLAYHDDLTGLPNRKLFQERLEQALEWAKIADELVGLLFLDLDGFKSVNDGLGHDAGDLLLQETSKRLVRCLRGSDTVARLGGDEFTVLLPGVRMLENVARVAEKVLAAIAAPFVLDGRDVWVTVSAGISIFPNDGSDPEVLLKKADAAMLHAKECGKNCYEFAGAEGEDILLKRDLLEATGDSAAEPPPASNGSTARNIEIDGSNASQDDLESRSSETPAFPNNVEGHSDASDP